MSTPNFRFIWLLKGAIPKLGFEEDVSWFHGSLFLWSLVSESRVKWTLNSMDFLLESRREITLMDIISHIHKTFEVLVIVKV